MPTHWVLLAIVLSAGATSPAGPAQPASPSYRLVLDLYRAGETRAALLNLARLTSEQIASAQGTLLKASDSKVPEEALRAASAMRVAALLHTDRAIAALNRDGASEWSQQFRLARRYIEKLVSRDPTARFPRTWWLLVTTYVQGQFALDAAKELGDLARHSVGDGPELFLVIGATEEMAWTGHEADPDSMFKGDLKDAERAYRNALAAQPDLLEARLRLGRVLTLRGDTQEAIRVLAEIGGGADTPYGYLARLFEGDAFERRGDAAEAQRRYLAAVALLPRAQSAQIALAHVRHASGARAKAAEDVRAATRDGSLPDTAEPWFWYSRGVSWRANGYLEDLLAMIRQ